MHAIMILDLNIYRKLRSVVFNDTRTVNVCSYSVVIYSITSNPTTGRDNNNCICNTFIFI